MKTRPRMTHFKNRKLNFLNNLPSDECSLRSPDGQQVHVLKHEPDGRDRTARRLGLLVLGPGWGAWVLEQPDVAVGVASSQLGPVIPHVCCGGHGWIVLKNDFYILLLLICCKVVLSHMRRFRPGIVFSVNRCLDYLFYIWPLTTMKIFTINFAKVGKFLQIWSHWFVGSATGWERIRTRALKKESREPYQCATKLPR